MPIPSKADGNVSFLGNGRARYNVLSNRQSTWIYHRMATAALTGERARSTTETETQIDPVIKAGRAEWVNLTKGGLYSFVGNYRRPLICEAIDNPGSATLTLIKADLSLSRNMPTSFPFVIAPGEYIKATGGSAPGVIGFLLRIDDKTIL
jgi:hypothetical protein